jgi:F-type H+-transporting ATPase subunit b
MLTALLASTSEVAASGGITDTLTRQFGVEGFYLGMQVVSFTVLALTLYFMALKPVLATMDERNKKIDDGLRYAREMESRLASAQAEAAEKLKEASIEAGRIVNEARSIAKDIENRAQMEAQRRSEEMIAKATQAIELDRQRVMAEARAEITRLVVSTTEKVLRTQLAEADRARFNSAAAKELAGV